MTNATSKTTATDVPGFVDRIIRPLTHLFNPLILRVAGGWWFPMFSLLHHHHLVEATVVDIAEVKSQLPPIVRYGSALAGMHKVLRMRMATTK